MSVETVTERSSMLEKHIERKLVKAVEQLGGMCPKFVSPGLDGVPDRIILLPGGHVGFCEVKAPGARPRRLQRLRKQQLEHLGYLVFVIDGSEQIGGVLDAIQAS